MIDGVTAAARQLPRWHRARHRIDRAPRGTDRGIAAGPRAVRAGDFRNARPGHREEPVPGAKPDCRGACWRTIPTAAEQSAQSMRALSDRRSRASRRDRCLRRCDHFDLGDRRPDRPARQGSAGHRRPDDRPRHRSAARPRRAAGAGAGRAISRGRWPTTNGRASCSALAGVLIGLAAALFVVRRTVRPLKADRRSHPRAGRRREGYLDSRNRRE